MTRRTILLVLAAVTAALVLGVFLFSRTERSRQYVKTLIERRASSVPGLDISLGTVSGSIISRMEIKDIEITIAGERFVKIDSLSSNYSIPLLYSAISSGKLHLSGTRIYGLDLLLLKDESGLWNFKRLKGGKETGEARQGEKLSLILKNNVISDSRVSIVDRTKDKAWEFDLPGESLFSANVVELTKKVEIDAAGINFDYVSPRVRIRNLKGKIDIASWNLAFRDAGLSVEGMPFRGEGTIRNLKQPDFDMTVYLDALGINGMGELNVRAETKVSMRSLDDMAGTVEVSTPDSSLNGKPLLTDLETVRVEGTQLFVEGSIDAGFGKSLLKGRFDLRKWLAKEERNLFDFTLKTDGADADELTELLNFPPYSVRFGNGSAVNSDLRISGSWSDRDAYSLLLTANRLEFSDGSQGSLRIGGYLALGDGAALEIESEAKKFRLNFESPGMQFDDYVTGTALVGAEVPGAVKFLEEGNLHVKADLKTDEFYGMTGISSVIDAGIRKGTLTIERFDVTSDDFSLSAQKAGVAKEGLDCAFEFISEDIAFLSEIDERFPPLSGKMTSRGRISGTFSTPFVSAISRAENFAYRTDFIARDMAVLSSVRVDPENPAGVLLDVNLRAEKASVLGNSSDNVQAKLRGTGTQARVKAVLSKQDGSFVSSTLAVENLLSGGRKLKATSLEGLLGGKRFENTGEMLFEISPGRMTVRGDEFIYGEGRITNFSGRMDSGADTVSLRAEMADFDPLILSKALNFPHDMGGKINGKIEVGGSLSAPSVQAEIKADGFFYGISRPRSMQMNLRGKGGRLSLDLASSMDRGESLRLRGELRIPKSAAGPLEAAKETSMDLDLTADGYSLDFARILTGSIRKIEGSFSSEGLSLKGTFSKPRAKGNVEVNGMELFLVQLRNGILAKRARFSFNGTEIRLPRTELGSKAGRAYLEGEMDISDFTYSADLRMEEFRFNPHLLKMNLSGDLDIEKRDEFLRITGTTKLTSGRISLYPGRFKNVKDISFTERSKEFLGEFSLEEENRSGFYREKTAMDISVDISSGTWIRTKEANFNTRGKLILRKKPGADLDLQGNIVSSSGYYAVFGKLFDIEEALLNFTGDPQNPGLNVKAYHNIGDIDINVNVTGDLSKPDLSLSSSPELEEVDIISYMVFGISSNRLESRDRAFVGKFATAVAAGGISELLSSEIGLDLLSIQEGERGFEDSTLKVGSYVTRDIFVSYERSPSRTSISHVAQMRNKLNVEWKLNRKFSVESQVGGENPGVDFFYNFNF